MSNSRVPIHQRRRDRGQTIILVAVALVSLLAIAALQFPVLFCELEKMRLAMLNLEKRRIKVTRKSTKTNAGARLVELNRAATEAACKLYRRSQLLGASDPNHYLLPADLSRQTKSTDPLMGGRGFDPTRHQTSWRTSWRSLRKAGGDRILDRAKKENRDLTMEEQDALKVFQNVRFHDLRHTFITMMAELGVPLPVVHRPWSATCPPAWCAITRTSATLPRAQPLNCSIALARPPLWGILWGNQKARKNHPLSC